MTNEGPSVHMTSALGLSRSGPQRPPNAQKKRGHRNHFSVTSFQGTSPMRTNLPCSSKFGLLCFPLGRKFGSSTGDRWREAWRKEETEKETALPPSEGSSIKGGLLSRAAEKGWKGSQGSGFPKKRLNRDHCVSCRRYPKGNCRCRKDLTGSHMALDFKKQT